MSEELKPIEPENIENDPETVVNNYGETKDSTVVIEEADRTVMLTENETIVIEKESIIDVVPKNRPRKVYGGMWGSAEIATVGMAMLAILTVILLFIFFVMPRQKELEDNRAKRDKLEQDLLTAKGRYGNITSTETRVAELLNSVNDFETRFLKPDSIGKSAIYQQINGLISAYGLTNTTGPDYAPLEINQRSNNGQQAEKESGRARFQSLFPGDYVTMTVEGSYQNLRRFIRELETSNQFIVISTIELEPADSEKKEDINKTVVVQTQQQPVDPRNINNPNLPNPVVETQKEKVVRGKTRGEFVSLRLEIASYYRRPNFQPTQIDKKEEQ
ncbi:hypothetical protein BH10ACI1_BH10ACI1_18700 [soil metagenome]